MTAPVFPDQLAYAEALFIEAIRHLEDAHVLHSHSRHAGAVASCLKASELGVKAIVVRDGANGWWNKVHETHQPMTDLRNHPILSRHFQELENHTAGLPAQVIVLEQLNSVRPGGSALGEQVQANTEYPFFYVASENPLVTSLAFPRVYITPTRSEQGYRLVRALLAAIDAIYGIAATSPMILPPTV